MRGLPLETNDWYYLFVHGYVNPPPPCLCICIVLIHGLSTNLALFAPPSVGVNFSANNPSSSVHYAPFSPLRRCIYNPHITQL